MFDACCERFNICYRRSNILENWRVRRLFQCVLDPDIVESILQRVESVSKVQFPSMLLKFVRVY